MDDAQKEYKNMMEILSAYGQEKIRDCLQENLDAEKSNIGQSEELITVTYGDVVKNEDLVRPRDVGLTVAEDFGCQMRLDYIFEMDIDENIEKPGLVIDSKSTKIEPNFTAKNTDSGLPNLPFTQLSDHYGVSTSILYKNDWKNDKKKQVLMLSNLHLALLGFDPIDI